MWYKVQGSNLHWFTCVPSYKCLIQCIDIYMYLCGCVPPYIMLSKKVVRVCCFVNKARQFCEQINALDTSPFIQQQTLLIQNQ